MQHASMNPRTRGCWPHDTRARSCISPYTIARHLGTHKRPCSDLPHVHRSSGVDGQGAAFVAGDAAPLQAPKRQFLLTCPSGRGLSLLVSRLVGSTSSELPGCGCYVGWDAAHGADTNVT